jgi:ubiquitin thioesterase OTU1
VSQLLTQISEKTSLSSFDLKFGYPPQTLDLTPYAPSDTIKEAGIKLNGEQIIVQPKANEQSSSQHSQTSATSTSLTDQSGTTSATSNQTFSASKPTQSSSSNQPLSLERKQRNMAEDTPEVAVPTHESTMVLRVMPDDNSCMFRAVGSATLGTELDAMTELRSIVAQTIQANPDRFSQAMLDNQKPDEYCKWIMSEYSWGGDVELAILSEHFEVEICVVDVVNLRIERYNRGKPTRCIVVWSGIHYDTIALSPSEPPYTHAALPPDCDVKVFSAHDDLILEKALELCAILKERHYYTDTNAFTIKCNVCGWTGKGEKGAQKHAEETGHTDFAEGS